MKQQFTGSYTLSVASRTIVLQGIEILQERLAIIINSTAGFVYHNIEQEPTARVTISGGNTVIVFPQYKDCHTHRDTDGLSIFYDDGVDLGQLIQTESDETQAILPGTKVEIAGFRTEVKAESDETQAILQGTKVEIAGFRTEVKTESDETQAILRSEFEQTKTRIAGFRTEVKTELDDIQILLRLLPDLEKGFIPALHDLTDDLDVDFVPGGYGPSRIIFSSGGVPLKSLYLFYGTSGDALGKIVSVSTF